MRGRRVASFAERQLDLPADDALLVAAGELPDPLPPPIEELALRYFELHPPEVKA